MNKRLQVGLVIKGNVTHSAVLRLPILAEELGPIKSGSIRIAKRFSNMLQAGYAVATCEELQTASLILLRLPDSSVPQVVDELCASDLPLKHLSFVLCESWLTAEILKPLAARGAAVATLIQVPTVQTQWFLVEGQVKAVRQIRRLLSRGGIRSAELIPESKHLLFASELLTMTLPISLLAAAQQILRAGGLSGNTLWALLDQMAHRMLLDFSRSPRNDGGGPLAECSPEVAQAHLDLLRRTQGPIALLLDGYLQSAAVLRREGNDSLAERQGDAVS